MPLPLPGSRKDLVLSCPQHLPGVLAALGGACTSTEPSPPLSVTPPLPPGPLCPLLTTPSPRLRPYPPLTRMEYLISNANTLLLIYFWVLQTLTFSKKLGLPCPQ